MITTVIVGLSETQAKLARLSVEFRDQVDKAVTREAISLTDYVKRAKLSGQALTPRTGTLRRSINWKIIRSDVGSTAQVGSAIRYGAVHEYGWAGVQSVRAHLRDGHEVRPFTRQMRFPARSFLRSSLAERKTAIIAALKGAVASATAAAQL